MGEVIKGKLIFQGQGKDRRRRLIWQTKKDKMSIPNRFSEDQLSSDLASDPEKEIDVELELENGLPRRIRRMGKAWSPPGAPAQSTHSQQTVENHGNSQGLANNNQPYSFHNPYNFIPALAHDDERVKNSGLGDSEPCGHARYLNNRYTGRIAVKMTVETPLLLPDTGRMKLTGSGKDEHRSYPVRIGVDGKPHIEPTAIKGMLRSAYEAITNSRLGVFAGHDERLAFRSEAAMPNFCGRIETYNGGLHIRKFARRPAVLQRYRKHWNHEMDKLEHERALKYSDSNQLPQHGEAVWVKISDRTAQRGRMEGRVIGQKVDEIRPRTIGAAQPTGFEPGWVCVTGANAKDKVYERVFLETTGQDGDSFVLLTKEHEAMWKELISNYQVIHQEELSRRKKADQKPNEYLGDIPGKTAWSRHIYDANAPALLEGTLCYGVEQSGKIKALIPVMISRRLFSVSPLQLLPASLHPARNTSELSPADRVFGWVAQDGSKGAYRGQLRIGSVNCLPEDAVQDFLAADSHNHGLPLAILGQPKPQQGRFYVAQDKNGNAQRNGLENESTGYNQLSKGLRGRKVYPHHKDLPDGYWVDPSHPGWKDNPLQDKTQQPINDKYYQEYRRPAFQGQDRDNQNRSIHGWVKPNTEFVFMIQVMNLTDVELGGLLWLLTLQKGHFHRLGGGKSLGFGSVRLELQESQCEVYSGDQIKLKYSSLSAVEAYDVQKAKEAFESAAESAYGKPFVNIGFIRAFLRAATGFDTGLPIHYPRARHYRVVYENNQETRIWLDDPVFPQHKEGLAYEWFVENNKEGRRHALSDLVNDKGLPTLDRKK